MNLERNLTIFAGIALGLLVVLYAFGVEDRVFDFAPTATVVTAADGQPEQVEAGLGQISDLQMLATYQATLPNYSHIYSVERQSQAAQSRPEIVEQIANLQELAEYQSMISGFAAAATVE